MSMEEKKPLDFSNANLTQLPPSRPLSGKRKFSNVDFHSSSYLKIRNLVQQLRPQFIQVLQTPDFKNSKAAHELRTQMDLLMNLYKQMMPMEVDPITKVGLERQPSSVKPKYKKQSSNKHHDFKVPELHRDRQQSDQSAEKKATTRVSSQVKFDEGHVPISYVIGGSAVGWNYIFFRTGSPVYYGVTKESFRKTLRSKNSAATNVSSHKT